MPTTPNVSRITFDPRDSDTRTLLEWLEVPQDAVEQGSFESHAQDVLARLARLDGDTHVSGVEAKAAYDLLRENHQHWKHIIYGGLCRDPRIGMHLFVNALRDERPDLAAAYNFHLNLNDHGAHCYGTLERVVRSEYGLLQGLHFSVASWTEPFPEAPWKQVAASVVSLIVTPPKIPNAKFGLGSAVALNPNLLLTARHVLIELDESQKLVRDAEGNFRFHPQITVPPYQSRSNAAIDIAPEQILINQRDGDENDVALIVLPEQDAVNVGSLPFAKMSLGENDPVILMGWPVFGVKFPSKKNGSIELQQTSMIGHGHPETSPGRFSVDVETVHGYSGGACLNEKGELLGIVSQSFNKQQTLCMDVQSPGSLLRIVASSLRDRLWSGVRGLLKPFSNERPSFSTRFPGEEYNSTPSSDNR